MVKDTYRFGPRYAKADPRNLRENPYDDLTESFAEGEADREAEQLMSKYTDSPNFRRRVVRKLAQTELLHDPNN